MSNKNTKKCTSNDSIAPSNWCSHPGFFLSLRRRTHKLSDPPSPPERSPLAAARVAPSSSFDYKKRLSELERDINRLKKRIIGQEKHCHTTKRPCLVGEEEGGGIAAAWFPDGSFLHEITRIGKPWERLCMHVSSPTVSEDAVTAAEVLQRMTKMKIDDLCKCLMSLMPMADITGLEFTGPASQPYHPDNELQFLIESILFDSIKKLEELVMEGLKIQMGGTRRSQNYTEADPLAGMDLDATASRPTAGSDRVVMVALIQVRDPKEDFGSVGELMIGLIEAQLGENGALQFSIEGVHVAGLNLARNKIAGRDFMWSASLKCCGGSDGSGVITRNPDCLFPSSI